MNPTENLKRKTHLIDELENSFQNCTAALTSQEHFNSQDTDELKPGAEQTFQKFIDVCRQTEVFFINKRLILSKQKPEQVIKDETEDLKAELERKDALIRRNQEKLQKWQVLLNSIQRGPGGSLPPGSQGTQGQTFPQPQPQQMHPPHYNVGGGGHMGAMGGQMYHPHHVQGPPQSVGMMMPPQGPGPGHQPPPAYSQVPSALASLETMSSLGMQERR